MTFYDSDTAVIYTGRGFVYYKSAFASMRMGFKPEFARAHVLRAGGSSGFWDAFLVAADFAEENPDEESP